MKKIKTEIFSRIVFHVRVVPGLSRKLLLALLLIWGHFTVHAQDSRITLHMDDVSLGTILKEIRDQSGKNIVFSNDLIDQYAHETIHVESVSPEEALEACLGDKPVTFSIRENVIIIEPAQEEEFNSLLKQTVRGTIKDKESSIPLPGANVIIQTPSGILGGISDARGNFKLEGVRVGRHTLQITYVGYHDVVLPEIYVGSAKEVILDIELTENVEDIEEVIVRPYAQGEPMNDMAVVSARSFSVEETKRYAGAASDPGRMALSFAGVNTDDDLSNQIVVRGNSPNGMLWRMEGVEIPVPNHFYQEGYDAGYVSVLSADMLGNSDFYTGAFPAEYGNGTSGVFDMSMRNGNNQKREYSIEVGSMGADLTLEGPFSQNYRGSYLINARYATFAIMNLIGVRIDGDILPEYQDLSYKFYLPTKKAGTFSIWGLGGVSMVEDSPVADSSLWEYQYMRAGYKTNARTGSTGITHKIFLGSKSYLRTALAFTGYMSQDNSYTLTNEYEKEYDYNEKFQSKSIRFTTTYNQKFSPKATLKTGLVVSRNYFDYYSRYIRDSTRTWITDIDGRGQTNTLQGFAQYKYKFSEKLQMNLGLHYMYFALTDDYSLEPRFGLKWFLPASQSLSLGISKHSQHELLMHYAIKVPDENDSMVYANPDLKLRKAYHFVIGYSKHFRNNFRINIEAYYQHLYDLPVAKDPYNTYSSINDDYFGRPLVSKGKGRNYGIELTVEKFFVNNYYFLFTHSLFMAQYQPLDGRWYNSRYNNNYITNFTAGKEFVIREKNTLGLNMRFLWSGGKRDSPIDMSTDPETGEILYHDPKRAYEIQYADYIRLDLGVSYRINNPRVTHEFSVDIQNVTNRENINGMYYSVEDNITYTSTMTGILPFINYKLQF